MKKLIVFLPLLFSATFLFAQNTVVHDANAELRNVTGFHDINFGNLNITLSSGADFKGTVTATQLDIDQSSGSDMDIKGKVTSLKVSTSSGSDFNGYELVSETCKADASSGSDIEITVNKELQ